MEFYTFDWHEKKGSLQKEQDVNKRDRMIRDVRIQLPLTPKYTQLTF
jgi:hypothetical protein